MLALENAAVDPGRVITAFSEYMDHGGLRVTQAQFEQNLYTKLHDPQK